MTSTTTAATPTVQRSWPRWLLIASLALNALFIGMAVSAVWRFGRPPPSYHSIPGNLVAYVDTLPAARERELLPGGKPWRATIAPLRRELREARRDLIATIAATPFDRSAYERAQGRLFDVETRVRNEQGQLLASVLSSLTPDERRAYLRWYDHRRGHGRRPPPSDDDATPSEKR